VHSYLSHSDNLTLFPVESEPSFNLSKATKLRDLVFRPGSQMIEWITEALRTITSEHRDLQQITIYVPRSLSTPSYDNSTGLSLRVISRRWPDLDHLLVQLWESHSIRPRVGYEWLREEGEPTDDCSGCLFPEIMKRGIVDLVPYQGLP